MAQNQNQLKDLLHLLPLGPNPSLGYVHIHQKATKGSTRNTETSCICSISQGFPGPCGCHMEERERNGEKRFKPKIRRDDWAFSLGEQALALILHPCGLDVQSGTLISLTTTEHHKIFLDLSNYCNAPP